MTREQLNELVREMKDKIVKQEQAVIDSITKEVKTDE